MSLLLLSVVPIPMARNLPGVSQHLDSIYPL